MKRHLLVVAVCAQILSISASVDGCGMETVPIEENLPVLPQVDGAILQNTHEIEGMEFVTTYDIMEYNLSRWRVTDSKKVNMTAQIENVPSGASVLVEHVHIDISLKSTDPQLDGLIQDSMDDSYHGTSQDGFWVNEKYPYQNIFAIEGFSKDLIEGWTFVCGSYGSGSIGQMRLSEKNLVQYGKVYANKMQVVYDILIKYPGEEFYHVVSLSDEFLIPVTYEEPTEIKIEAESDAEVR